MNMKIIGILLIGLGIVFLVYQGITYKTKEKVVDIGPVEINHEKTKTFPFSPVLGGAAVIGGIVLLSFAGKRTS